MRITPLLIIPERVVNGEYFIAKHRIYYNIESFEILAQEKKL
jgi:hypothetical protein